jgi:PPK2 family polyphosphate:nucleotide phosphotransferase
MPYLYTIDKPTKINWDDFSTDHVDNLPKEECLANVQKLGAELDALQEALYAASSHSVLIVLQAMDTGGKDGTIEHVFKYVNPQGCQVRSFKQPNPTEAAHDFLWRAHRGTPAKGMITIFNRSHYEDVLVTRVHDLVPDKVWKKRYSEIEQFESLLASNDTIVMKFYLHISKEIQRERLLAREADPVKAWKLSAADWREREYWEKYQDAYADAIGKTAVKDAPWFVVPANNKGYRNHAIADKLAAVLRKYKSQWDSTLAKTGEMRKQELAQMRADHPAMAAEAAEPNPGNDNGNGSGNHNGTGGKKNKKK